MDRESNAFDRFGHMLHGLIPKTIRNRIIFLQIHIPDRLFHKFRRLLQTSDAIRLFIDSRMFIDVFTVIN